MIKVGDRILCKNNLSEFGQNFNFTIGKNYTIEKIIKSEIYMYDDLNYLVWYENVRVVNKADYISIWNYFYTPNEVRKMKLERLKDV